MQKLTDDEFIAAWHRAQCSPQIMADQTGLKIRGIYGRRKTLAEKGLLLTTVPHGAQGSTLETGWRDAGRAYTQRTNYPISDGRIVVFSDAHWWPGQPKSVGHRAMLEVIKAIKPKAVVNNGDAFDGASTSRHPPLGWAKLPTVKEELEICDEYLHEIRMTAGVRGCDFFWNVGNHDRRFDYVLAQNAAQYEGVVERLEEKFHDWTFQWSLWANNDTIIKHKWHNGIHATYNNALKSGKTIVTGHLHRLAVTPWGDYNGRRWGVDTGTLSDPLGPQFDYLEDNPTPWCSGFAVLTFKDGVLLPPELCEVINGKAYFRSEQVA